MATADWTNFWAKEGATKESSVLRYYTLAGPKKLNGFCKYCKVTVVKIGGAGSPKESFSW